MNVISKTGLKDLVRKHRSTADDLAVFAQMILNGGSYGGASVLSAATVKRMITPAPVPSGDPEKPALRALGWDVSTKMSGSRGDLFPVGSFGHTGFTGTSLWIDPGNDIFVLLLTNRVNPTRENRKIGQVRIAVADAVMGALQGCAETASLLECPAGGR